MKKIFCNIGILIIAIFLILCIMISTIIFAMNSSDAKTFSGWNYDNIYSEISTDGSNKIDIMIRKTFDNGYLPRDSWYVIKITVTDTRYKHVLAEYEGTSVSYSEEEWLPIIEWDNENGTVSVSFDNDSMPKVSLACKYDKFSIFQESSAKDYISFMMITGFVLIISVLLFEIFIGTLYRSYCRKKYIEQPQPENSEQQTDSENKA